MIGKTIEEMKVGDTAKFSKTVSESDVYLFAGVTGDLNPAHVSEEFAKDTFFKTRIAHGMLSASFISTVIGTMLPGPGSVYMRQEANFLAPVKFGDTITAVVEVAEISVILATDMGDLLSRGEGQHRSLPRERYATLPREGRTPSHRRST